MMRTRDKLESYRVLATALHLLGVRPWQAVLVGDGPARAGDRSLDGAVRQAHPFRRRGQPGRTHRALCLGRPLRLACDQRSLWHGLPRSPGRRRARRRRPHRWRACRRGRWRRGRADSGRRCRRVRGGGRPSARPPRGTRPTCRQHRRPHRPRATTIAQPRVRWPPRWELFVQMGDERRRLRRAAPCRDRLERGRPPAGHDGHPPQRQRRGRCADLAPAIAGRPLEAPVQSPRARAPHRRAAAAGSAGVDRFAAARDELRRHGKAARSRNCGRASVRRSSPKRTRVSIFSRRAGSRRAP